MPKVALAGQAPFDFSNAYLHLNHPDDSYDGELEEIFNQLTTQMFIPNQTQPTTLTVNNQVKSATEVAKDMAEEVKDNDVNVPRNEILSVLVHQSSRYRNQTPENWLKVNANSLLIANNLPVPSNNIIYTYDTDIQNQAKDVLKNPTPANRLQLRLGLTGNLVRKSISDRWVIVLTNPDDYQQFKTELNQVVNHYQNDPKVNQLNRDIQQINLDSGDCFTSWVTNANPEPNSINRLILETLNQHQFDSLSEQLHLNIQADLNPIGFSFINVETLADSTQKHYNNEINKLKSITNRLVKFKFVKISKIKSAKAISNTNHSNGYQKQVQASLQQRKSRGFKKTLPSTKWQIQQLVKIVKKHISNIQSDNTYRNYNYSFMRPNRRHPNDHNLRGRVTHIKYRPDIHIYLDTSGSISESQYKTAVMLLIKIAKKLNTNLYFTSFSHRISQPVKLQTKKSSLQNIYQQIQNTPKVSGGTEYEQVWNMIDKIDQLNQKTHKAPRLNFMITDFEYSCRTSYSPRLNKASTKNTYYIPLAANQAEYARIQQSAMDFANSLIDKNDINIKSRMLM